MNPGCLIKFTLENRPFPDTCSKEIMVELNEDVQNDLSKGFTGKYTKGIGTYAGRPYWRKDDKAIWYHEEKWMIGKDMYLGGSSQSLQSMDSTFCPDSVDASQGCQLSASPLSHYSVLLHSLGPLSPLCPCKQFWCKILPGLHAAQLGILVPGGSA